MSEKSLTVVKGHVPAIMPETFGDVTRMAKLVVMAGMFKNTNQDEAHAQATMAIMQGLECGIPPMQAIQNIAIINGRPCIWGSLVPALIWKNGHKIKEWSEGEDNTEVAYCEITRGDNDEVIKRSFSAKDAEKAGLLKKSGPWTQYRSRMLQMRARGFCANDAVPDVLRGMYLAEEAQDFAPMREQDRVQAPEPPAPPAPPEPPVAIEAQSEPEFNVADFMGNLEEQLAMAQDADTLGENWAHLEATMEDNLDRGQREEALELYQKHEKRIGGQLDLEEAIKAKVAGNA
jgi:hypothetical protein